MKNQRLEMILELVQNEGEITVEELSQKFKVTPKTIRLDLTKLEDAGVIRRTFGGVIGIQSKKNILFPNYHYNERKIIEKKAIATKALKLIKPNSTICLDDGSTTLELAKILGDFPVNVITHDINIINELGNKPNIHLVIIGGIVEKSEIGNLIVRGEDAIKMIKRFSADICFIGTSCVDFKNGYTIYQLGYKEIKRSYLSIAKKAICLADSDKFNQVGFTKFATPKEIKTIVTDDNLKIETLNLYKQKGFNII